MAVESKIYSLLSGSTVVTTLLGTRIFPLRAPDKAKFPYVVYTRISGGQFNGLDGYLTLENPRIQIDTYSTSYTQVKSIAENIHTVMQTSTTFSNILLDDSDLFEDELLDRQGIYRISQDYSCFNRE